MTKQSKAFEEYLTKLPPGGGLNWVLKGSEEMQRYPLHIYYNGHLGPKGILTFGTKRVDGLTCCIISNLDVHRALPLGGL